MKPLRSEVTGEKVGVDFPSHPGRVLPRCGLQPEKVAPDHDALDADLDADVLRVSRARGDDHDLAVNRPEGRTFENGQAGAGQAAPVSPGDR